MNHKRNIKFGIASVLAFVLLICAVFFSGFLVGSHGAKFLPNFARNRFDGHGIVGTIDSLGANTLVVKDRQGQLKTILVDNETKIRSAHAHINFSDLSLDEKVIILGNPQKKEGTIKAKIVHVVDHKHRQSTSSAK